MWERECGPAGEVKNNSVFCKAGEDKEETSQHPYVNCFHVGNLQETFKPHIKPTYNKHLWGEATNSVEHGSEREESCHTENQPARNLKIDREENEKMRIMLIYLITGNKEGNAGDYDEDDRGQEGLAHVEGQLPLRFQMETLPNRSY